jgi:hypothetical protein
MCANLKAILGCGVVFIHLEMCRGQVGFAYEARPTGMINVFDSIVGKTEALESGPLGLKLLWHLFAEQATFSLNFRFIPYNMGIIRGKVVMTFVS